MTQRVQYLPAILAVVFCLTVTPVLAIVSVPVKAGGPVLIVARPGTDLTELVETSGGHVVGVTQAPLAVMGASESEDFEQRLKRNGALAILDGEALAWLCGDTI